MLGVIAAAGGTIALAITVITIPGIAIALAPFLGKDDYQQKRLVNRLTYLKRSKQIEMREKDGKVALILTETGRSRLLAYQVEELAIERPKKWDDQWRLVIFDIPVKQKVARDILRGRLKLLGFRQLQESVWIHPYPCHNEVEFLATLYEVWPFVKVLTVSQLPEDDQERLKKLFNLE